MAKKNQHAKQGFGVNDPQDAIHMGQGKRIRLEDVPADGTTGDKQVGNRAYNDARYQAKSGAAKTTRWLTPLIVQWSGTGLVYNHSQATFEIEGEEGIFTVQAGQKTLAVANPDNGRFDRFAANTDGQVIVIQGTPSPDPAEPSLPSPDTQIAGPVVFVGAGATEPSTGTGPTQIQNVTIYNENVAPEWANTYGGPGTADFNNTLNPFTGTRSINVSNVQNNSVLTFIAPADFNVADYDSIGMQLRLKELMLSGYNIRARFLNNAGVAVSNQVTLAINKNLFGAYQFIGIPMDQFTFTASTARRLELRWARGSGSVTYVGFFLDALVMQGGIIPSVVNGDVILQGQVQGSGKTGTPINVTVTEKFISDQTAQTDPLPGTAQTTFRLADGSLRKVSASMLVAAGVAGDDGWSPVFGLVTDGERRVLQLVDWVGGEGTKPSTGQYIGPTGLVATPAEAVDLRGSQGATGAPGTNGTNGTDGTDGREVELRVSGTNLQWRYVGDVSWITLIDLSTVVTGSGEYLGGFYRFDTATGAADPGSGKLRFNAGTVAATTAIYIDPITDGSTDIANYIKSLKTGDVIYIQNKDTVANWVRFRLTADSVDNTGYYTIAVVFVNGSGTIPGSNEKLLALFSLQNESTGSGVPSGGTTGQVLTKQSNTDGDADWQNPQAGEAAAVNAGSRLYLFNFY